MGCDGSWQRPLATVAVMLLLTVSCGVADKPVPLPGPDSSTDAAVCAATPCPDSVGSAIADWPPHIDAKAESAPLDATNGNSGGVDAPQRADTGDASTADADATEVVAVEVTDSKDTTVANIDVVNIEVADTNVADAVVPGPCAGQAAVAVPLPPMAWAKAAPSVVGKVACGKAPAPFFWATDGVPPPIACTSTCAPTPHAEKTVCAGGQCLVARCAPDWQDRDGWGPNGCEAPEPASAHLYVDATSSAGDAADGSPGKPFASIQAALCVAGENTVVHVAAGAYAGSISLNKNGLVLRGEGPDVTQVIGIKESAEWVNKPPPNIAVEANSVVVEGIALVGGARAGIFGVPGADKILVRDVLVTGADAFPLAVYDTWKFVAFGAVTVMGDASRIVASSVRDVGSVAGYGWTGAMAGVQVATNARVLGVLVDGVQSCQAAAEGPLYPDYFKYKYGSKPAGEGDAIGIMGGAGSMASSCEVIHLKVGWQGTQPDGAISLKVPFGNPWANDPPPIGLNTDPSDSIDGKPWIHLYGCDGGKVENLNLEAPWAQIAIRNSGDVTVTNNQVTGDKDAPRPGLVIDKCKGCSVIGNTLKDFSTAAVNVFSSPNAVITGNSIANVSGSNEFYSVVGTSIVKDGVAVGLTIAGCDGVLVANNKVNSIGGVAAGNGIGIQVLNSAAATLTSNEVADIYGGQGDFYGFSSSANAIGILAANQQNCVIVGNFVHSVNGGNGWLPPNGNYASGAPGVGLLLSDATGCQLQHNAIVGVASGKSFVNPGGPPLDSIPIPNSFCVQLTNSGPLSIEHLTCANATVGLQGWGAGLVTVHNSIIANATNCAVLWGAGLVQVSWSNLAKTPQCANTKTTYGPGITTADPLFANLDKSDVHVLCQAGNCSPTIDAGDPQSPYCAEPAPNGCQVDLGAYGNTAQTSPNKSAKNCACP